MARIISLLSGKGGVGKSLAYDEFISLANGSVIQIGPYIDDLIEERKQEVKQLIFKRTDGKEEIFEVIMPSNDLILDAVKFDAKKQKINSEINLPIALMRKPAPEKLTKVSCAAGSVSVTPEHKFIVMRKGKLTKLRADEIKEKTDYLLLLNSTNSIQFLEEKVPIEVAELFGYLIGDGYMEGYKIHVFCASNDLLPKIRKNFESVFGSYKEIVSRKLHRISFFRKETVKELYEKYGVKISKAENKEIPVQLFNSSNESVAAFLRALFDCDGSAHIGRREIEFDSKSKKLVYQTASVLRTRFGILSQIKQTFKIARNGKMKEKGEYWRLYLTGENAVKFAHLIGFNYSKKQNRLMEQINDSKEFNTNIDLYPVGKILKQIRQESNISGPELAKILNCSKQMIYEYEWEDYALSKQKLEKYIKAFEKLTVKNEALDWLRYLIDSNIAFRRVDEIAQITYDNPYVYDFQISDEGGHFTHATGIIVSNTTITANLGIALAKRNMKVCVIDTDVAMANLSLIFGMQAAPITLHDVLLGEANIHDAIYDGPNGLKIIPSGLSLDSYRRVDVERISSVIELIKNQFDYILLDCPAGIEKNVISVLAASTEALLITSPDSPSVADVLKAKITTQRIGAKTIGVIINYFRGEKGEISKEDISKMLELPIYGVIPFDDEVRRSFMSEKSNPIILKNPKNSFSVEIQKIAGKLAGFHTETKTEKKEGFISRLLNKLFKKNKKVKK
ncbi:MAG: cell division ATPase MinD [Candidatus Diapherotrites archaeon]